MRTVAILGVTGSIGLQALDVVRQNPQLQLVALAAATDVETVVDAADRYGVSLIAMADPEAASAAERRFDGEVLAGADGVVELVHRAKADVVLNAIVGSAGLPATLAALEAGSDLALANKESLVAGGDLVTDAVRRSGRLLLPVDSEHSALQQCLEGSRPEMLESLVLTASGGPFRGWSRDQLAGVTREQALAHPTWTMGAKITIDSATLMNKGLELIEAHHLFGVPYDRIEVVVHPQSIVHGMARFRDGALLAHVGLPDMRVPISYALTHPGRAATPAPRLDLSAPLRLDFEPPDEDTFRCLRLARRAGEMGGTAPASLNAANEVAVGAFLDGRCTFLQIAETVETVLDGIEPEPLESVEQVLAADGRARELARQELGVPA
ncbi:MAG: 1-deoxy-D-xylulose-5-phosphate reductoisomerase [Gaiellales bacterium]|jgi:1-deoxy-D-xylulose-5-phosphate reductoisomerase|nr:1-deoxy-D-xylulose-5-phosphate reductoisomerase [Gaiellales bacterium]